MGPPHTDAGMPSPALLLSILGRLVGCQGKLVQRVHESVPLSQKALHQIPVLRFLQQHVQQASLQASLLSGLSGQTLC